jgi:hypothetical protein
VRLAKLVLRDMAARDEGRMLVTSSIASTTEDDERLSKHQRSNPPCSTTPRCTSPTR